MPVLWWATSDDIWRHAWVASRAMYAKSMSLWGQPSKRISALTGQTRQRQHSDLLIHFRACIWHCKGIISIRRFQHFSRRGNFVKVRNLYSYTALFLCLSSEPSLNIFFSDRTSTSSAFEVITETRYINYLLTYLLPYLLTYYTSEPRNVKSLVQLYFRLAAFSLYQPK